MPARHPPVSEGHHLPCSNAKVENTWRHTHTPHTASSCVQRKFMIKTNDEQPSENCHSTVFITIQLVRHVMPFRLVISYRLQSTENEGATFLPNVAVCYITRYTAPDPTRTESSRKCISYTQQLCYVFAVLSTYHVDSNFQFPSSIVQNSSVINDNVQSLEGCVCFLECFCNIHNKTVLNKFSALLTFLQLILVIDIGCRG